MTGSLSPEFGEGFKKTRKPFEIENRLSKTVWNQELRQCGVASKYQRWTYDDRSPVRFFWGRSTSPVYTGLSRVFKLPRSNWRSKRPGRGYFFMKSCVVGIGILIMVYEIIPTFLGSISSPMYPKQSRFFSLLIFWLIKIIPPPMPRLPYVYQPAFRGSIKGWWCLRNS